MDQKSQTRAVYDARAAVMAEKFNSIGPRIKDIVQAFSYVKKENPVVFEIGCGNGRDAREILKHTTNYVGVDYSVGLLDIARAELPTATFELADIESYKFPKGIDIIFSFASLLHSDKEAMKDVLSRAYDSLNEGGVFFLSLKHAPYKEEAETDAWGTRVFYFYTPELMHELAGNKYSVVFEKVHVAKSGVPWFEIILQK